MSRRPADPADKADSLTTFPSEKSTAIVPRSITKASDLLLEFSSEEANDNSTVPEATVSQSQQPSLSTASWQLTSRVREYRDFTIERITARMVAARGYTRGLALAVRRGVTEKYVPRTIRTAATVILALWNALLLVGAGIRRPFVATARFVPGAFAWCRSNALILVGGIRRTFVATTRSVLVALAWCQSNAFLLVGGSRRIFVATTHFVTDVLARCRDALLRVGGGVRRTFVATTQVVPRMLTWRRWNGLLLVGGSGRRSFVSPTRFVPGALASCRRALIAAWSRPPVMSELFNVILFSSGVAAGAFIVILLTAPWAPAAAVRATAPSEQSSAPAVVLRDAAYTDAPVRPAAAEGVVSPAPQQSVPVGILREGRVARGTSGPTIFRGSLSVNSAPRGAKVFVNGVSVGSTPLLLESVPAGSRVVRVELDGYRAWTAAVRVVANEQAFTTAVLQRLPSPQ